MNKFIVIIRPEFMLFCKDACQAAALNHLLFRIAGKSKDAPQEKIISGDILWYAKNEQIVEEMSNAWGLCKVRQEVNRLIKIGLIGRKNNPEWGADRTKHFCFGEIQCRKFLAFCKMHQICVVHLELPNEVKHLIYSSNANDKSIKCICSIHQMELMEVSNANDKYIEAITKEIPTEDRHTKEEESSVTSAIAGSDAPALFIHPEYSFVAFDDLQHPTLMVVTYVDDDRAEITNKSRRWIEHKLAIDLEQQGIIDLKILTRYERVGDAVIDAPAPIDFTEQKKKRDTEPRIPALKIGDEHDRTRHSVRSSNDSHSIGSSMAGNGDAVQTSRDVASSHSQADIGNEETVKLPAVPKQTPAAGAAIPPSSDISAQAPSLNGTYSTPAQRSGASLAGIPASPGAVQARQVIPKRPLRKVIEKPQLTFGGQQVREWYEQARECKVRMTDKNVITLNRLADIDEMTQENLRDVLDLYDTDKWLIEHNVTVDLQELEKQDGKFTFERGLLAVKRKRRAKGPASNISKNGTDLNQYGLQALLQRQEQKAV